MRIDRSCFICLGLAGDPDVPWTDRPVYLDPGRGGVMPGIGALTPGYVLICPTQHVPSFRTLRGSADAAALVADAFALIGARLGTFTYFEHGGGGPDQTTRTSSCIDHAHIHVIPGHVPLTAPNVREQHEHFVGFLSADAGPTPSAPYLLWGHSDGGCQVASDVGESQYFRKQLARLFGSQGLWDYAAAPGYANVRETIRLMEGQLEAGSTSITTELQVGAS